MTLDDLEGQIQGHEKKIKIFFVPEIWFFGIW